jgi:hypothetical protein
MFGHTILGGVTALMNCGKEKQSYNLLSSTSALSIQSIRGSCKVLCRIAVFFSPAFSRWGPVSSRVYVYEICGVSNWHWDGFSFDRCDWTYRLSFY